MMDYPELEKAILNLLLDMKPAQVVPKDACPWEMITLDFSKKDNTSWRELLLGYLQTAKTFEIHCWNDETEWIALALQYGELKADDWKHGKIITGSVTPEFMEMLLHQPKPEDTELYHKMTPFFDIYLDDTFQSCHYGTENYYRNPKMSK